MDIKELIAGGIIGALLSALVNAFVSFLKSRKEARENRLSPFSGYWGQFIYHKDDKQCKGKIVKRDEYILTHQVQVKYLQHLKINIKGSIFRIRDTDPYEVGNHEDRQWECIGHCENQILMLFYKAITPYDSQGCVLVKLHRDGEYRGYYIADHTQKNHHKEIDLTPVILKKMTNRYAVFDWDNTIRKGYTIFPWIKYLNERKLFDEETYRAVQKIIEKYEEHEISHDQYAKEVGDLYGKGIKGKSVDELNAVAEEYISDDEKSLYPGVKDLFEFLYKEGIDIIVVSGAPNQIIKYYKERFHIEELYDLQEEVRDDRITGEIATNYGFSKELAMKMICEEKGCTPYMAFGDSSSDFPLLDGALYPFYIHKMDEENRSTEYVLVSNDDPYKQIMSKIGHISDTKLN